ncbi:MAG: sigma-70 family RNA polymerase sigma factor [Planctomycetaceae bacterium]|nr:sigma-70 family RNA polymerase sigma factor [Planctomycetaceae bacterium]
MEQTLVPESSGGSEDLHYTSGDDNLARELFARYGRRLAALAEKHLNQRLARRVDGEDVVQSVFRTFFRRSARGDFRIDDSVDLWNLLVQITLNKTRSEARKHTAERRDVRAEIPGEPDSHLAEQLNREPGPLEAAAFIDQIESLLEGLPEIYSDILTLRLEGYSQEEIAGRLNITQRTVRRALKMMRGRLNRSLFPDRPSDEPSAEDESADDGPSDDDSADDPEPRPPEE